MYVPQMQNVCTIMYSCRHTSCTKSLPLLNFICIWLIILALITSYRDLVTAQFFTCKTLFCMGFCVDGNAMDCRCVLRDFAL